MWNPQCSLRSVCEAVGAVVRAGDLEAGTLRERHSLPCGRSVSEEATQFSSFIPSLDKHRGVPSVGQRQGTVGEGRWGDPCHVPEPGGRGLRSLGTC